jgi:DNA-binding LacI/PurR family transcriptional regulator
MSDTPHSRPTVRTIAAATGVSAMTVSLALRNHPRIPATTRLRVQRAADKLGYRPDPHVAKLMHHLRVRRKVVFQASVGALTTVPEGAEQPYLLDILHSARRRAEQFGYGFNVFRLGDATPRPDLQRVLRSRGVDGIVLLPLATPRPVNDVLDWTEFSVVSTTYGVLAPKFHRVVPHQFSNAL